MKTLDVNDLISRYQLGESVLSLAQSLNVSRQVVIHRLSHAGIEIRSHSAAANNRWSRPEERAIASANTSKMWESLTRPEDRQRMVSAAHQATKGRSPSMRERLMRAATRQKRLLEQGEGEEPLIQALRGFSIENTPQCAVGPYNIDIALHELPIAVEIENGGGKGKGRAYKRQRIEYLFRHGWCLLYVCIRHGAIHPLPVARKVISLLDLASRDHTVFGQYGMIDGQGKPTSRSRKDFDGFPRIPGF